MGAGLLETEVLVQVDTLNKLFSPRVFNLQTQQGTRNVINYLRAGPYPNLLSYGGTPPQNRQGSLFFAASVLTPHLDLSNHPGKSFRRWLKWLIWLRKQPFTYHDQIVAAINLAVNDVPGPNYTPSIHWKWTEDKALHVDITGPDGNGKQTITVTSVSATSPEVDNGVDDDDDNN